jgi:hypothetical protein
MCNEIMSEGFKKKFEDLFLKNIKLEINESSFKLI